MRSVFHVLILLVGGFAPSFAQGPPLNGTAEQLFDAGMNAFSGSALTRDNFAAVDYFRRSAQKGYAPAQVVLGSLYDTGTVVSSNAQEAADWYKKAADQGDPLAQWLLGRLFFTGSGVQRDWASAQKWLSASASQNNPTRPGSRLCVVPRCSGWRGDGGAE